MWAGYKNGSFFRLFRGFRYGQGFFFGGSAQEGVSAGYYIGVVQEDMVYGKCFFYVCVPSVYGFVGARDVRMDVAWP
ncbi:hypothetical protein [Coprobacter secundus]|uniref:hypothetical protein n=1 Tax=Coprobacter secundus TaxID=1501392 RepID=UPI0022E5BA65|nr:hypothetical protein [Coprobacter secundus]